MRILLVLLLGSLIPWSSFAASARVSLECDGRARLAIDTNHGQVEIFRATASHGLYSCPKLIEEPSTPNVSAAAFCFSAPGTGWTFVLSSGEPERLSELRAGDRVAVEYTECNRWEGEWCDSAETVESYTCSVVEGT